MYEAADNDVYPAQLVSAFLDGINASAIKAAEEHHAKAEAEGRQLTLQQPLTGGTHSAPFTRFTRLCPSQPPPPARHCSSAARTTCMAMRTTCMAMSDRRLAAPKKVKRDFLRLYCNTDTRTLSKPTHAHTIASPIR